MNGIGLNLIFAFMFGGFMFVLAAAVEVLSLVTDNDFNGGGFILKTVKKIDVSGWARIFVLAIIMAVSRLVCGQFFRDEWANWICLAGVVIFWIYYLYWMLYPWSKNPQIGWMNRIRESVPVILMLFLQYTTVQTLVRSVAGSAVKLDWIVRWGTVIAVMLVVGVVAYRLWKEAKDAVARCQQRNSPAAKHAKQRQKTSVIKGVAVLLAALVLAVVLTGCMDNAQAGFSDTAEDQIMVAEQAAAGVTTEADEQAATKSAASAIGNCTFYNFQMINTQNPFNFGPCPGPNGTWNAAQYKANLKKRSKKDPALLAAVAAYVDSIVGTRFMGKFYDTVKGDWAAAINKAKERWIENGAAFQKAHTTLWAFLDRATVQLDEGSRQCQDLMYMNPYTGASSPDVIVLKTEQATGPWLVFKVNIKGNIFEVPFRCPCGYQPSDCQRLMGITPSEKPQPTRITPIPDTSSTPESSSSTPESSSSTPESSSSETSSNPPYEKDKSKSSNSGKNDDSGAGSNTNTGSGSQKSSKEKTGNSGNMNSYEEYKESIGRNKSANQKAQQQQSSGNAPSYKSSASGSTSSSVGGKIDSNANSGSGHGGVDSATSSLPVTPPVRKDKQSAKKWSGPAN